MIELGATNWSTFLLNLQSNLDQETSNSNLSNVVDLEQEVEKIHTIITKSYESACPLHKHKAGQSLQYYTSDYKEMRKKLRRTFNEAKSPKSKVTWTDFYDTKSL